MILLGSCRLSSGSLIIEHNLEVIRAADWVIDLGPEGGDAGGRIVVEGTPEQVAAAEASHTGRYLRAREAGLSAILEGSATRNETTGSRVGVD